MANFEITKIKPPFPKGRIYVFRAEQHCTLRRISIYVNATEPKDIVCVIDKGTKKGKRSPEVREWKKATFELKAGNRLIFILDSYPNGIEHIDLYFTVTKYTGRKNTGHKE